MKLKNLLLIALVAIVFCGCQSNYQPTSITVASYNLRNANGGDSINGNGWGQRYPVIAQIVQYHDFDIFGTQECFIHQLKDMKEALPGYDYIGVGRDDGKEKGEHSAIFYRTDKFDVIEKGDFLVVGNSRRAEQRMGCRVAAYLQLGTLQMQGYRLRIPFLQPAHGPYRQESTRGKCVPRTGQDERTWQRQRASSYPDGRLQCRPDPPVL